MPICDAADLARMKFCLVLKLSHNPKLVGWLLETGTKDIIEDCGRRKDIEIDGKKYNGETPFWGARKTDAGWEGRNELGKLWMKIRDELQKTGESTAVSPQGDTVSVRADTPVPALPVVFGAPTSNLDPVLSDDEKTRLETLEAVVEVGKKAVEEGFVRMVKAMYAIYQEGLFRENGRTFAEYFQTRWQFERAHSYRLIQCGRMLETMKSAMLTEFTTQGHFRPLLFSNDLGVVEPVLDQVEKWRQQLPALAITPSVVESAAAVVRPAQPPVPGARKDKVTAEDVLQLVDEAAKNAKSPTPPSAPLLLADLRKKVEGLTAKSSTGIAWTNHTWNPLQGCAYMSEACRHCYAAKQLATRMAAKFPGIAMKVPKPRKGKARYLFTGKVELLVRMLGEPLEEKRPSRYFVNSMADLFYGPSDEEEAKTLAEAKKAGKASKTSDDLRRVPDWFIDQVFAVMEKAKWHQFQVLTKRPKRMADYTAKRYGRRRPPANIWLGTTIENQKEHDRRMPHLNRVVTAVRWVSAEPLLSAVNFDLSKVHWVVVGGESGGHGRKMQKAWATGIRDQCQKAKVPFFFKQWGDYGEDGKRKRREKPAPKIPGEKKKPIPPPKLDGAEIQEYPSFEKPTINREFLLTLIGKDRPTMTRWINNAQSTGHAGQGGPLWWSHEGPPPVAGDLFFRVTSPGGYLDIGTTALKKVPKKNIGVSVEELQSDGKRKVVMAEFFTVKELEKVAAAL